MRSSRLDHFIILFCQFFSTFWAYGAYSDHAALYGKTDGAYECSHYLGRFGTRGSGYWQFIYRTDCGSPIRHIRP